MAGRQEFCQRSHFQFLLSNGVNSRNSLVAQQVKDPGLSLVWLGVNPWPWNFCMPWAWPKFVCVCVCVSYTIHTHTHTYSNCKGGCAFLPTDQEPCVGMVGCVFYPLNLPSGTSSTLDIFKYSSGCFLASGKSAMTLLVGRTGKTEL